MIPPSRKDLGGDLNGVNLNLSRSFNSSIVAYDDDDVSSRRRAPIVDRPHFAPVLNGNSRDNGDYRETCRGKKDASNVCCAFFTCWSFKNRVGAGAFIFATPIISGMPVEFYQTTGLHGQARFESSVVVCSVSRIVEVLVRRKFEERSSPLHKTMLAFLLTFSLLSTLCSGQINVIDAGLEPFDTSTLECHRRIYTYQVSQSDANGRQCWDTLSVWACWGRCDSNEIADWRFPYKKSSHPVCVHYGRTRAVATLRHCEEGAHPSAARYEYLEAAGCQCQLCSSSDTSCEGLTYRSHRSHPDLIGFDLHK